MAHPDPAAMDLAVRVETLEQLCMELRARIEALEAGAGRAGETEFHISREEPTV